ncbi:hypothetical protein M9Y10_030308 [Tritrichomonas musculus]|uniref:Protein kinase domain-containing protein n=1 Tax=Tritrichomonas musculus TaxID=1915356 RepID=A0ABR2KPF6_9EUKA
MIIIYGIARAMKYLHEQNIIHGNLSTKTVLLDKNLHPKLSDFTHSEEYSTNKNNDEEIILYKQKDIRAFSLIIFELMSNDVLYNENKILSNIYSKKCQNFHPKFNCQIPDCFINLIQKCCSRYPTDRPSFDEIIELLLTSDFINCLESDKEKEEYYNFIFDSNCDKSYACLNICNYQILNRVSNHILYSNCKILEKATRKCFSATIYKSEKTTDLNEYEKQKKHIEIMSKFDYLSILKYIGCSKYNFDYEPYLTIINEYTIMSLRDMLKKERKMKEPKEWDNTKKLFNIYGIAAGMKYLHSKKIIHRNLSLDSIHLDENYYPKISSFDYIELINEKEEEEEYEFKSIVCQSKYASPEVINGLRYSKSSDVFSFSIILYEIITNENPFSEFESEFGICKSIKEGYRPAFDMNQYIPKCYKELIETCWSEDPNDRPSFSKIVHELETNQEFISEDIDRKEYDKYIESINEQLNTENKSFYERLKDIPKINIDEYRKINKIYSDTFCKIYIIQKIVTNQIYECKVINKETNELSDEERESIMNEISIINKIKHPNIVQMIGIDYFDFKRYRKIVYLNEYSNKGTLHDYLMENTGTEEKAREMSRLQKMIIIYGIARAMKYLHEQNIIHGNLSTKTVLLDKNLHPKLSDFTHSEEYSTNKNNDEEIILYKQKDIRAFSLIIYETIMNICTKSNENEKVPDCFNDLIEKCCSEEQKKCTSFDKIEGLLITPEFFDYLESAVEKEEYFEFVFNSIYDESNNNILNIYKYERLDKIIFTENEYKCLKAQEKTSSTLYMAHIYTKETINILEQNDELKKQDLIISKFDHPSLLKYFGYSLYDFNCKPHLTMMYEYSDIPLSRALELEKSGKALEGWNMTKKLINIYGIAAGMNYLHLNNILHRNLTLGSIFEDKYFYPKISNFLYVQKLQDSFSKNDQFLINPKYASPEVIEDFKYSKSSDVYSFSIILYEIVTNEDPFSVFESDTALKNAVFGNYRPKINQTIPECYKNLIESCWCANPTNRLSFQQIVELLKTNQEFITEDIDKDEYYKYIESIDSYIESLKNESIYQQKGDFIYIDISDYEQGEKLGKGSFGSIFRVKEKSTGKLYAAKISKNDSDELKELNAFNREIKIMFKLNHPSIIKIKGFSPLNFKFKPHPTIIYELAKCNLRDIIELESHSNSPPEWVLTKKHIALYGIASGMQYMHSLNIFTS